MKSRYSKIGFIGGGRITRIFLEAFRNKDLEFDEIRVFEPDATVSARLKEDFTRISLTDTASKAAKQELVFLAVHPPVIMELLNQIKDVVKENTQFISLAPKINIAKIESVLASEFIARMIPNATSYINDGYNPVSFCSTFGSEQKEKAMELFKILGETFEVAEEKLEGYAIVSAMLPTYFWFQWEQMEEIARLCGIENDESADVIHNTLKRSVNMFYNSDLPTKEIIDLIPVKPIGEHEDEIKRILESKLMGLYTKIKP